MAKKNGRKKIRKIKPGKNLPEKISGKLWAENLPANLFEKKNPEKKNGNQADLTPEEYPCLFRRASMIAGEHDQKRCWAYLGMLVQERLEELAQYSQPRTPGAQGAGHVHTPGRRRGRKPRTAQPPEHTQQRAGEATQGQGSPAIRQQGCTEAQEA